jgi:hypothetical protein
MLARSRRSGNRISRGGVIVLLGLLAACGGGGVGTRPSATPSGTLIAVAGDYTMAVALTENTCGAVQVAALPTRVEHTPGATQFRLTHGLTYAGTLANDGAFTTDAQTVTDSVGAQTVRVAGRFTRTGLEALASVAVQTPTGSACRYAVQWTGTKQGAPNVIP